MVATSSESDTCQTNVAGCRKHTFHSARPMEVAETKFLVSAAQVRTLALI